MKLSCLKIELQAYLNWQRMNNHWRKSLMTRGHTYSSAASLILVTALALLTGCSAIAPEEVDLPVVSLSGTPNPTTSPSASPSNTSPEKEDEVSDGFAELEIEDQGGDGSSVEIEEVRQSLGNAVLVIFDTQRKVLGSSPVTVRSQPVAVQLNSPILKSQKLIAQLFLDNGNGTYDLDQDTPILDHDGDLAREDFEYKLSQG
jgi:hypothetical protein